MKVRLTLFGDLRQYLPAGSRFNHTDLELSAGARVADVLAQLTLPEQKQWFLMVNGDLVHEADYAQTTVNAGDEVVLFPPIKGG